MALIVVLVFAGVAYRVSTEAERARFASYLQALLQRWWSAAKLWYHIHEPYFEALRARTRFAPVTPALALANVAMFVVVLVGGRGTLVEWGASIGPRTTNGEWWRLVTSLFVHTGPLHLLACLIGFVPLSYVLERLVGPVALVAVYFVSGVLAGLAMVADYPTAVSAGASAAICGVYGLAAATMIRGMLQEPKLALPGGILKKLAWAGLIFLCYNIPTGIVAFRAELTGFTVGALCGIVIAKGVGEHSIPVKRTAIMVGTALIMALAAAVSLRGITDFRPDIDRMLRTDERTAATFREAATKLALGRTTEKAMVVLIEREILPALESEQPRLVSRGLVPDDQQALVAAAGEYLRLRIESWRLRATAFRKGSMAMLRQADNKEGAARDVLARNPYLFLMSPT